MAIGDIYYVVSTNPSEIWWYKAHKQYVNCMDNTIEPLEPSPAIIIGNVSTKEAALMLGASYKILNKPGAG